MQEVGHGNSASSIRDGLLSLEAQGWLVPRLPSCTGLVPQTGQHLGGVSRDPGFGGELLTTELDGDLLERA